ncbi:glycosyltransferase [candidate division KSB1 bacterium]|nr:glycosyltransferase [candidate division KSB1 bacterium]
MIFLLYIALFVMTLALAVAIVNIIFGPALINAPGLQQSPEVSVLIPARNEERNIGACLTGMLAQDYPEFEVIVLNDQSQDRTESIVREVMTRDRRIKFIQGQELPTGWTGKSWACYQLSQHASGDILIFTDADTRHETLAISNTVAFIQKYRLDLLSALPQQETVTLAEKMVVPIIDLLAYASLPLWLTYYAPNPSLAAANGQWIAFTRESYEKIGGHQAVKHHLVEDTELSRLAKRKKMKILTTAGTGAVFCRMYTTAKEVWWGFSKNFYGLAGYRKSTFFSIIGISFIGFVLPYFLLTVPSVRLFALAVVGLNSVLRGILALRYKHPIGVSIFLHPFSILVAILIGFNSFFSYKRGTIRWKDRDIHYA